MPFRSVMTLLLATFMLAGWAAAQRGPSTPEERERLVELARKLQKNPLDRQLVKEREWAVGFLLEAPDVPVRMCGGRELGDFMDAKYRYKGEVTAVALISAAAFVIQNPERAQDALAQYQAGTEGVLLAYRSIARSKPKGRSPSLDALLAAQERGELAQAVERNAQACL